jgi:hypothetical protein
VGWAAHGGPLSAVATADKAETVAKDSALHTSTSALAAGSTISLKWHRKFTPMMGKETAANKNVQEKCLPWKDKSKVLAWDELTYRSSQLGA